MSARIGLCARGAVGVAASLALLASGCDPTHEPLGPETTPEVVTSANFARSGRPLVTLCHRSNGSREYISITVAAPAVEAHIRHGDGLVGDPVPAQPGMEFDADCEPVPSRQVTTVTGSWNGTSFLFTGLFTVASNGPVDATATVSASAPDWPLRLFLLGFNPEASTPPGTCGTQWLATLLSPGPTMTPPTVAAHWADVPPGTYCLNVTSALPVPPFPPEYSWTATITHP